MTPKSIIKEHIKMFPIYTFHQNCLLSKPPGNISGDYNYQLLFLTERQKENISKI